MKGKVFSSSQDLYQDQAKILFDFYKDAAEKIVSQEEELEKEMGELKNSLTMNCLLYTSPSPRDSTSSRMPSSA